MTKLQLCGYAVTKKKPYFFQLDVQMLSYVRQRNFVPLAYTEVKDTSRRTRTCNAEIGENSIESQKNKYYSSYISARSCLDLTPSKKGKYYEPLHSNVKELKYQVSNILAWQYFFSLSFQIACTCSLKLCFVLKIGSKFDGTTYIKSFCNFAGTD